MRPKSASQTDAAAVSMTAGRTASWQQRSTGAAYFIARDRSTAMHAYDTHLATDPYRSAAVYQLRVPIRLILATIDGNAATDERSRPRQDGRGAVVAGGITGAFTAEHAATRTGCGDRVFRRRELAVSVSPHSRSEERASDRPPTGGPGRHVGKMITYSAPSSFVSSSSNHALT